MLSIYPACFYKEKNGYSVIFPDLNHLATCGDTLDEAVEMAVDCLAVYLYTAKEDRIEVPMPSDIGEIVLADDFEYESAFVNVVAVDVEEYAKAHFTKSVKKTLTIPMWLNLKATEMGINFSQTLQEALIAKVQG